jgi:hypothetical protein
MSGLSSCLSGSFLKDFEVEGDDADGWIDQSPAGEDTIASSLCIVVRDG